MEPAEEGEEVVHDYASVGLTLRSHPLALLREKLQALGIQTAADLAMAPDRRQVYAAGLVVTRQQPETANGTVFISLEDEHGDVQVICHRAV